MSCNETSSDSEDQEFQEHSEEEGEEEEHLWFLHSLNYMFLLVSHFCSATSNLLATPVVFTQPIT